MSIIHFWKYQGAGNDFILLDQRQHSWIQRHDAERIAYLCDRHFGIGADGLITLSPHPEYDFEMVYFNADGREGTMCGNGGRCAVAFAYQRGIHKSQYLFQAVDGAHEAELTPLPKPNHFWVSLRMADVAPIAPWQGLQSDEAAYVLNTGSPHYVRWTQHLDALDMRQEGRAVRYAAPFREKGINVNLVETSPDGLRVRTYERGVEDETLACGTGVTAVALCWHAKSQLPPGHYDIPISTRGGHLRVRFTAHPTGYTDVWLCGPAVEVFSGSVALD